MEEAGEDDAYEVNEAPKKSFRQRCCSWSLGWKTLLWTGIVTAYLLFGGLIFSLAERPNELDTLEQTQMEREEALRRLQEVSNETISRIMNATNETISEDEAEALVDLLVNISASLAIASQELQVETSPLWTYSPAVFFSATVITTIGYGNTAPVTSAGRTLFVFYAMIGIPLCLIFLGYVGQILSNTLDALIRRVMRRKQQSPTQQTLVLSLVILSTFVGGLVLFIFFPALIFYGIEDWTYGEAAYYCFVTLTTVGFGDFVPAQRTGSPLSGFYRICAAVWIMFGLAWLALLIARIQAAFEKTGPFITASVKKVKTMRDKRKEKKANQSKELVQEPPSSPEPPIEDTGPSDQETPVE